MPVAFLNPPIVHRTAALLAAERRVEYKPARYLEGVDTGDAAGLAGLRRKARASVKAGAQRLALGVTRLPLPLRRSLAAVICKRLPQLGTGPSGDHLRDWAWVVEASATSREGAVGLATPAGTGHPDYTATAAFIVEVALAMLGGDGQPRRSGCRTLALVFGLQLSL